MAAVASPQPRMSAMRDEHVMDTRTPSPVQRTGSSGSSDTQYKPDLSAEVALLSTKLVNAINYQTNLDDSLQQSRHELQQARQQLARVQSEKKHLDDLFANGVYVRKSETDKVIGRLRADVILERAAKEAAEKAKKQTEGELENLTTALFEEANTMVAVARKDAEGVEKRNAQLKSQLEDTELLLASQQEQLQDLKATMERLQKESQAARDTSIPSTPVTIGASMLETSQTLSSSPSVNEASPEHPLYFSSLITPVLRHDTAAFTEFQDLLVLARRLGAHSRTNSSNSTHNPSAANSSIFPTVTSSSPNTISGAFSLSANSSPSSTIYASSSSIPPLKESKFYKRVLTEDIEPTLRLDLAPGLSFLSRRTVVGSLLQGTLAVEPFPQNKHYYACALCGESRRSEAHIRRHRFKTSEDDTVPKPICEYCVARVRTTADFYGFLRVVRDGHWRCDSDEDHQAAWEESIRLRERMFWARSGGGVVPHVQHLTSRPSPPSPSTAGAANSTRHSLESIPETKSLRVEAPVTGSRVEDAQSGPRTRRQERPKSSTSATTNEHSENLGVVGSATGSARDAPIGSNSMSATAPSQITGSDNHASISEPATVVSNVPDPITPPSNRGEIQLEAPDAVIDNEELHKTPQVDASSQTTQHTHPQGAEAEDTSKPNSKLTSNTAEDSSSQTRKTSAVLARVRAMESHAQSSLPGSFD